MSTENTSTSEIIKDIGSGSFTVIATPTVSVSSSPSVSSGEGSFTSDDFVFAGPSTSLSPSASSNSSLVAEFGAYYNTADHSYDVGIGNNEFITSGGQIIKVNGNNYSVVNADGTVSATPTALPTTDIYLDGTNAASAGSLSQNLTSNNISTQNGEWIDTKDNIIFEGQGNNVYEDMISGEKITDKGNGTFTVVPGTSTTPVAAGSFADDEFKFVDEGTISGSATSTGEISTNGLWYNTATGTYYTSLGNGIYKDSNGNIYVDDGNGNFSSVTVNGTSATVNPTQTPTPVANYIFMKHATEIMNAIDTEYPYGAWVGMESDDSGSMNPPYLFVGVAP